MAGCDFRTANEQHSRRASRPSSLSSDLKTPRLQTLQAVCLQPLISGSTRTGANTPDETRSNVDDHDSAQQAAVYNQVNVADANCATQEMLERMRSLANQAEKYPIP